MKENLRPGEKFPDIELPSHEDEVVKLSSIMRGLRKGSAMFRSAPHYLAAVIVFCAVVMFGSTADASTIFWYFTGHTSDGTLATGAFFFDPSIASGPGIQSPVAAHYTYFRDFNDGFVAHIGAFTLDAEVFDYFVNLEPVPGPFTQTVYDIHSNNINLRGPGNLFINGSLVTFGSSPNISLDMPLTPPADMRGFTFSAPLLPQITFLPISVTFDSLVVPMPPTVVLILAGLGIFGAVSVARARRGALRSDAPTLNSAG